MMPEAAEVTILLADDGRPGSGLWRIFPCGGVALVEATMSRSEVEALQPHRTLRLSHLSNVEPYEVLTFEKCKECDGSGCYSGLCIFEGEKPVARYDKGAEGLYELRAGDRVGHGNMDCPECDKDGWTLAGTGLYVERDALVARAAA